MVNFCISKQDLCEAYAGKISKFEMSFMSEKKMRGTWHKSIKVLFSQLLCGSHMNLSHNKLASSWPDKLHSLRPFPSLDILSSLQWLQLKWAVLSLSNLQTKTNF